MPGWLRLPFLAEIALEWLFLRVHSRLCDLLVASESPFVNLLTCWLVGSRVWVHIVCLHVFSVHESAGRGSDVVGSVVVEGWLSKICGQRRVTQ